MFKSNKVKTKLWEEVSQDNPKLQQFLQQHGISFNFRKSFWNRVLFRREYIFLMHDYFETIMVWRRAQLLTGKPGTECVLFINNSFTPHHELIKDASVAVGAIWKNKTLFVFMDEQRIRYTDGDCFHIAGWKPSGNGKFYTQMHH